MSHSVDPFTLGRRVELLYRNLLMGQIFSVINAITLTWISNSLTDNRAVYGWLLATISIAGYRIRQAKQYRAEDETFRISNTILWRKRAQLDAILSSIIWASGALLLMWQGNTPLQLFTAFVMAGMVAGAVPVLAADRLIFRSYAVPIVLAVFVGALGSDALHIAFSLMSIHENGRKTSALVQTAATIGGPYEDIPSGDRRGTEAGPRRHRGGYRNLSTLKGTSK